MIIKEMNIITIKMAVSQLFIFTCVLEIMFLSGVNYIFYQGGIIYKLIPAITLLCWLLTYPSYIFISHFLVLISFICGDYYFGKLNSIESDEFANGIIYFGIGNYISLVQNLTNMNLKLVFPSYTLIYWFAYGFFISTITESSLSLKFKIMMWIYATVLILRVTSALIVYKQYNTNKYELIAATLFIISDLIIFGELRFNLRNNKVTTVLSLGLYWVSLICQCFNIIF